LTQQVILGKPNGEMTGDKVYISDDTISWLLEEDNPSVRYLTLVNILGRDETDKEVAAIKGRIMEEGSVRKILSHQRSDGSFLSESLLNRYGRVTASSGYLPKYKGTIWQAIFLAQFGADAADDRIRRLCRFVLDTNYSTECRTIGIYTERKGDVKFITLPCYVANMVWSLSRLGFYHDSRIQDSIKWLLKYQRFDDGDFNTPTQWPYQGRRDRCFSQHSCYIGCTQALKAMTVIPPAERDKRIGEFINKAIAFVLLHRIYKRSRDRYKPIRAEYKLMTFPLTYYDDVPAILETLLFFGVKNRYVAEAVKFVSSKRNMTDRWVLEKTVSASSMYTGMGRKGKENKWITYRAANVFKKYGKVYGVVL